MTSMAAHQQHVMILGDQKLLSTNRWKIRSIRSKPQTSERDSFSASLCNVFPRGTHGVAGGRSIFRGGSAARLRKHLTSVLDLA